MATPPPIERPKGRVVDRPLVVTTFRVFRDQLVALQHLAIDRRAAGAAGRADASALLREIIDEALGRRRRGRGKPR